jgi:hypothetical protein
MKKISEGKNAFLVSINLCQTSRQRGFELRQGGGGWD